MPHFRLTYRLTGMGLADAEISDGREHLQLHISYIGSGIDAAADAAIALMQSANRSEFIWLKETGYFFWILEKQQEQLQITVLDKSVPERRDEQTQVLFRSNTTLLKFGIQVGDTLHHLLEKHGSQGYAEQWGYPFPLAEYERLAHLIRDAKRSIRKAQGISRKRSS